MKRSYLKRGNSVLKRSYIKRTGFKKRRTKTERQVLIDQLDQLVRDILALRDKVCQMSGATTGLNVCHFISRAVIACRWDLDNVIVATSGINNFWMPKYKTRYRDFMVKRIGLDKVEQLEWKERKPAPIRTSDMQLLKLDLLDKLEYYQKKESL